MDVEELVKTAWEAVEKAGLPEPLQAAALKGAMDYLREGGGDGAGSGGGAGKRETPPKRSRRSTRRAVKASDDSPAVSVDDAQFFESLANESGTDETVLRDALQLKNGKVHVIPPTRKLGSSKAEQTRRVIAMVAGAQARGLGVSPADADAVRAEAKRKHCFDPANFASTLKAMKGFSPGSTRQEIIVGSRWIEEFNEAVATATGTGETED
jgi:hypothetical protein